MRAPGDVWPALVEQLGDGVAARVGRLGSRVADRQHEAAHRRRRVLRCCGGAHGIIDVGVRRSGLRLRDVGLSCDASMRQSHRLSRSVSRGRSVRSAGMSPRALLGMLSQRRSRRLQPRRRPAARPCRRAVGAGRRCKKMTLEEKVGQMIVSSFQSSYLSTDSRRVRRARRRRSTNTTSAASTCSAAPSRRRLCCSIRTYGTVTLGQPLDGGVDPQSAAGDRAGAAAQHRRFRGAASASASPARRRFRARWRSARRGDERLAYEAGRITGEEARALGVHVNFAPVVDVNNNPRNPVINTRSFGEDPASVGRLASAYVRGLQAGRRHGDAEALSRPRRHRRRLASRPAGHQASARAARRRSSCRRSAPASPPAPTR